MASTESMDIVRHSPTMKHLIVEVERPLTYGTDVLQHFHHVHHDVFPPAVEHCGGAHRRIDPRLDYTIEHCECKLHRIDKRRALGHDENMNEITWRFEAVCPFRPDWYHMEQGLPLS